MPWCYVSSPPSRTPESHVDLIGYANGKNHVVFGRSGPGEFSPFLIASHAGSQEALMRNLELGCVTKSFFFPRAKPAFVAAAVANFSDDNRDRLLIVSQNSDK